MNKMDEIIIVAPRKSVFDEERLTFQGHEHDTDTVVEILQNVTNSCSTMRRGDAEENEAYKQPIPYAVIKRDDEIFVYERLAGGGESKLHNKLSLGVGGHMNETEDDLHFSDILIENLMREINEELNISTQTSPVLDIIGLINDDEDPTGVGKVHLGILAVFQVSADTEITVRETEELDGKFISIESLKEKETYDRLENWSKIVVDIL